MPIPPLEYLIYAREHYDFLAGNIDMASSNIPELEPAEFAGLTVDTYYDLRAPARFEAGIAAHYQLPEDEVAIMLGTSTAMYLSFAMLLKPGDIVAVESPAYEPLFRVPEGLGADVRFFARKPETGYALDVDAVMQALGETGRVAVISDPNNPTGAVADRDAIRELAARLAARDGFLIVDEVYRDFYREMDGVFTARYLAPNIIANSSFTKAYGLGWARAGWMLAPKALAAEAIERAYHMTGRFGFGFAAVGDLAIRERETLWARTKTFLGNKLDLIDAFVKSHPQLEWHRPATGIFGFVRNKSGASMEPLIAAARRHKLVLAPGRFFRDDSAIRLGGRRPGPDFEEGLRRLTAALQEISKSD